MWILSFNLKNWNYIHCFTTLLIMAISFSAHAKQIDNSELLALIEKSKQEDVRIILRPDVKKNSLKKLEKLLDITDKKVRHLEKLNLGVYTLNNKTLNKLIKSELASEIREDAVSAPSMTETLPRINATTLHNNAYFGNGLAVAVLDTGIDNSHPFLSGSIVEQACFSTNNAVASSLCPNGTSQQVGTNAASECYTETRLDACNHGTHVAGIIAGHSNQFSGVAPQAKIIAVQVYSLFSPEYCKNTTGCLLSYESDQLAALEWLLYSAQTANIVAVNLSLGSKRAYFPCNGDRRKIIIDQLLSHDIITVIAAGNNGYHNSINAPACITNAVSVSASLDTQELIPAYANRSPELDFFAPGSDIYSSTVGGNYQNYAGSSGAAAVVSGAFVLMKERFPHLSVAEIEARLKANSLPIYDYDTDTFYARLIFSDYPIQVCAWYGTYAPICHEDNGSWGWENNYACVSQSVCNNNQSVGTENPDSALRCNWYGHTYPICNDESTIDWGWENGASCITQDLCNTQE